MKRIAGIGPNLTGRAFRSTERDLGQRPYCERVKGKRQKGIGANGCGASRAGLGPFAKPLVGQKLDKKSGMRPNR